MGERFPVEPECRAPKSGAMLSELLTDDVWYDQIVEFYSPLFSRELRERLRSRHASVGVIYSTVAW